MITNRANLLGVAADTLYAPCAVVLSSVMPATYSHHVQHRTATASQPLIMACERTTSTL